MTVFTGAHLPTPKVRAVQALLVYEDQTLLHDAARHALTTHEITHTDKGVEIGAGRLLGLQDQQSLIDILLGALATESHFLPMEVICHSTTRLAWVVPGTVRRMWFCFGGQSHRLTVPWPNLLFCASGNTLYLAAYQRSGRPTQNTPLYHAPLMNVHSNTELCMGNAPLPQGWSLAHRPAYERAVFETNFSHTNHDHTLSLATHKRVTTAQHFRFWKRLHTAKASRFPARALVPLDRTAAQWLSDC